MSREEIMYLQDIVESCARVLQYTQGLTQTDLIRDQKTYDAVVRNLEIIGEAANNILWDVVQNKIPLLGPSVSKYLQGGPNRE